MISNLIRFICALIIYFTCPILCSASEIIYENTTRSGNINSDELWRGTITITGDVIIHDQATVTIEPGTVVRFSANSDDQRHGGNVPNTDPLYFLNDPQTKPSSMCSIEVFGGALVAIGTLDKKILFTSTSSSPIRGDWHSIQYGKEGSVLVLQNTVIEYGTQGIQINLFPKYGNISLNNNVIKHIVSCGICGFGPTPGESYYNPIIISNNDISDCGHGAIELDEGFIIENNYLHDNLWSFGDGPAGSGLATTINNSVIRNNKFQNNRYGLMLSSVNRSLIFKNIFICNNFDIFGSDHDSDTVVSEYEKGPINSNSLPSTPQTQVTEIYVATFGRAPDPAGLGYWVGQVEVGFLTIDQVAQSFFDQPETKAKYPQGTTNPTFITTIYQNVLNRDPDPAGLNYWVGELDRKAFSRSQAIMAIINGAKAASGDLKDAAILANKMKVGLYFAAATLGPQLDSSTMLFHAHNAMISIDSTAVSVTTAMANIDTLVKTIFSCQPLFSLADLNGKWSVHGLYAGDIANTYGWNYLTATVSNGNWQSFDQVNWGATRTNYSESIHISDDGVVAFPGNYNGIMDNSKIIVIGTGTSEGKTGNPGLSAFVKMSGNYFTANDLATNWFAHCLHVGNGGNADGWTHVALTVDHSGHASSFGLVSSIPGLSNVINGTLSISADGIITADGLHGVMAPDKTLMVITDSREDTSVVSYDMIFLVRAGATFSQDDLTGNWVMHALMADNGANRWAHGDATFDSTGSLSYSGVTTSNGTTFDDTGQVIIDSGGTVTFAGRPDMYGIMSPYKNILIVTGNTNYGSERAMLVYVKR